MALNRFDVDVECETSDNRIQKAYGGMRTNVLVFATNPEDAGAAAVEKMQDKWYRHRGVRSKWRAHDVREA
jgi:hypothetical protein